MTLLLNKDLEFYIGVPFCQKACRYCHYRPNIHFGMSSIPDTYIHTLLDQIQTFLQENNISNRTLLSCYFGGGTPSLLSLEQISSIMTIFERYGVSFQETSLEIHPAVFDNRILTYQCFNRFSLGIQSTDPQKCASWNRETYSIEAVRKLFYSIKNSAPKAIVNFDFLMEKTFSDTDISLIKELSPETVVFYPKTGMRSECDSAKIYAALKEIELLLDADGYFRINEHSFHFFKRHDYLSKYAYGEYSYCSDIIGFGHNSISRIGDESYLSIYSNDYGQWKIERRSRNPQFEALWGALPYGIPVHMENQLPPNLKELLREDKHFGTKYIPLAKDIFESFFYEIKNLEQEKQDFCWRTFFWSDPREKDLNLFFNCLDDEYNKSLATTAIKISHRKKIPSLNILIEGIDGSGKDTFAKMLIEFLKLFLVRTEHTSISLVGLPSTTAIFGKQCKHFIEDADISIPYDKITTYLAKNREDFCSNLNNRYPGLHIFVRSILTEQGTLSCLYPEHVFDFRNTGSAHIDLCIIINSDPDLARNRIEHRGIKTTWRETPQYLDFFNSFFLKHGDVFPDTKIVNNFSNSIIELRSQALKTAIYIYEKLCEDR